MSGDGFYSDRGEYVRDFPNFMLNYGGLVVKDTYNAVTNPKGIINFGVAENTLCEDLMTAKLCTPEMNKYESFMQYYFEFRGIQSFRESLATFLSERFKSSRPIDPENLIVTSGVGAAIDLLAYMICDRGDCSLVFAPYYAAISADLGMRARMECIPVNLSAKASDGREPFMVDVAETERTIIEAQKQGKRIRFAMVLNPHNPTGDVLTRDQLLALLKLFNKYDMHVILDEIYALSVLGDTTFTSVLSLEEVPCPEKTHFVWGFAKDFCLSGFRCGVIHTLQKNLAPAATHLLYMAAVPALIQNKLSTLISDKEWLDGQYFPANRKRLNIAYSYFCQRLKAMGAEIHEPKAGLFIWANLSKFLPAVTAAEEMQLFEEMLAARVYCVPGTAMFYSVPGWYRFTFTHPHTYLGIGLDRLESVLRKRTVYRWAHTKGIKFIPGTNGINGVGRQVVVGVDD